MPASPNRKTKSPQSHDRAAASWRRLKPTLSQKPIPVSPGKLGSDAWHDLLKQRSREEADQLKQYLDDNHQPQNPMMSTPPNIVPSPEEAVAIIKHQSSYIKQLENELRFCKGELTSYKSHLQQVMEENSRIAVAHHVAKMGRSLQQIKTYDAENKPIETNLPRHLQDLELLKAMHISKTEILEQQLASTREHLHSAETKIEELKSKLLVQESLAGDAADGQSRFGGLCVVCCKNEALIAARFDQTAVINQLTKEKDEMIDTLANIRYQLTDMQYREQEAANKVKESISITEQANLEKTQALIQREQVQEELALLKQRFEKIVSDHQSSLVGTKNAARQEVKNEIEGLESRLKHATHAEASVKAQLEKLLREKNDIENSLGKHKQELQIYHSSMVETTTGRKVDMTQLALERDTAVEERNKLKNRLLKVEQAKDEAILRVKQELNDVRKRLEKAEREQLQAKEENVKLTKENQQLEKELHQVRMAYNSIERARNDELASVTRRMEQREVELNAIINDTETRCNKQLNELETMYCTQNKLVGQLREECQVQAESIQKMSAKYRSQSKQITNDNMVLKRQNEKMKERTKALDLHEVEHERIHKKLQSKIQQLDNENRKLTEQLNDYASKNLEYMREIEIHAGEVKVLRTHLVGDPNTSPHSSGKLQNAVVVDDLLNALKEEMVSQDAVLQGGIKVLQQSARGDN